MMSCIAKRVLSVRYLEELHDVYSVVEIEAECASASFAPYSDSESVTHRTEVVGVVAHLTTDKYNDPCCRVVLNPSGVTAEGYKDAPEPFGLSLEEYNTRLAETEREALEDWLVHVLDLEYFA